jgi:predicted transcriptional regulator
LIDGVSHVIFWKHSLKNLHLKILRDARRIPRYQETGYDAAMASFLLPADELEYVVLTKLWELGAASVRDVHGVLGKPEGLVYTTIGKVIDRLHGKGLIQRERHGQAFVYRAKIPRQEVERARAQDAVSRLLGPTPRAAMAALVDAVDAVDPKLLAELERAVAAHRRSKRGA